MSIIEWCEQGDFVFQVVLWAIEIMFRPQNTLFAVERENSFAHSLLERWECYAGIV